MREKHRRVEDVLLGCTEPHLSSSAFIWNASSSQSKSLWVNSLTSCCTNTQTNSNHEQMYSWFNCSQLLCAKNAPY